jgi:hypothetical protein
MRKAIIYSLVVFLILVMASIVIRIGTWDILVKILKMDNVITRTVFFDENFQSGMTANVPFNAKKEYPFTKNKKALIDISFENKAKMRFNNYIVKLKKHLDIFFKDKFLPYNFAVNLALAYEGGLHWNINKNAILIGENYWILPESKAYINLIVASINDFNLFLQTNNIPLLFVVVPNKLSPDSIYNCVNIANTDKDSVIQELRKSSISVLDLRDNIRHENKDWHSLFYNTDHHWRTETGFWASKIVAEELNSDFSFDLDTFLLNSRNYNYKVYKDWFLGSIGRKVGHYLAKPDNFTLITPKFETSFDILSLYRVYKNENINFDSAYINFNLISRKDYYRADDAYSSYMEPHVRNALIHNKLNSNDKKILFLVDSNGKMLVPFLSVLTEYLVSIDLRHFSGSLETLIEKENPDVVIIAYDWLHIEKLFDFR